MKYTIIRCLNAYNKEICNNIIGVRNNEKITIKRHNRECRINLVENQEIEIVCERCAKITFIKYGENKR